MMFLEVLCELLFVSPRDFVNFLVLATILGGLRRIIFGDSWRFFGKVCSVSNSEKAAGLVLLVLKSVFLTTKDAFLAALFFFLSTLVLVFSNPRPRTSTFSVLTSYNFFSISSCKSFTFWLDNFRSSSMTLVTSAVKVLKLTTTSSSYYSIALFYFPMAVVTISLKSAKFVS